MGFQVTPTVGAGPYTFTAQFSDAVNIDGIHYSLEFYRANAVGSCPANIESGTLVASASQQLLQTGSYVRDVAVAANNCQGSLLLIRDLSTGTIISQSDVYIDNV